MKRRQFIQTTAGIAGLGIVGVGSVSANSGTLKNATVTSSGAIVATDDDFVIAGQNLTVDGSWGSPIITNNGYSGQIFDNTLTVNDLDGTTFGVQVEGGAVDVYDNRVEGSDLLVNQFLGIGFTDGAVGRAKNNTVTCKHRVGILARGLGTDVTISRNTVTGVGPTTSGWAENGIQVSDSATATVKRNTVDDHWWDKNDFQSSGIIVFGANDVTAQHNGVQDNDMGIAFVGERNKAAHNDVTVTYDSTDTVHYGVFDAFGVDNAIIQNSVTAAGDNDALVGVIANGDNSKLIGNRISGWQTAISAPGDDTKLPDPFDPSS